MQLTFKNPDDAKIAVSKFNGQSADGRILRVTIIGSTNVSLRGRLGVTGGTVDELMNEDIDSSAGSYVNYAHIPTPSVLID